MLEGLLSVVESPSNPHDSFVCLDSVRFEDNDGIREVRVMDYDCTEEWGRWRIRSKELRGVSSVDLAVSYLCFSLTMY